MANLHSRIPGIYRITFSIIDPVAAVAGTITTHFFAPRFLAGMAPEATFAADHQIVFDQLGATYFFMAFIQAVVLRATSELKIWKAVVLAIVLNDLLHLYASYSVLGAAVFFNPLLWSSDDSVNFGILYGGMVIRLAFLSGIGMAGVEEGKKKQ